MRRVYVYRKGHPKANENGMVAVDDLGEWDSEQQAKNAPIMVDRFYEGARTLDGIDIGSRSKMKAYMKATGVTHSSDFSPRYYEQVKKDKEREDRRHRRDAVARSFYEVIDRRK